MLNNNSRSPDVGASDVDEYNPVVDVTITCGVEGAKDSKHFDVDSDTSVVAKDSASKSGVDIFTADSQGNPGGQPQITIYPPCTLLPAVEVRERDCLFSVQTPDQ